MNVNKTRPALPRWVLPATVCGGILLLIICSWAIYIGGHSRQAAGADRRPDIFADSTNDQRH